MDAALRALLAELREDGRRHDAGEPERGRRLRNVEPETAELLALLVGATRARRVLEIGTSNGYSTIWLADALPADGRLVSLDVDAGRSRLAAQNLERAGLAGRVVLHVAEAGAWLAGAPAGAFELAFLDAEREAYPAYWEELLRVLAPGGLVAVDNAVSHAGELAAFRSLVEGDARVTSSLVPIGAGLLLLLARGER